MLQDRYGNTLSTQSTAARDAYVDGVDRFLAADAGVEDAFAAAILEDPQFALAHVSLARNRQMLGQTGAAKEALATAKNTHANDREAAQINALGLLIEGKAVAGQKAIRKHLLDHPRDVMAVQPCVGVFGLIGFSGLAGREAECLAFTTALAPHYGDDWWFLAQHAFAQLEIGQTGPAEVSIERALSGNPRNANGAHIRAHLYYENGETDAGLAYLTDWIKDYDKRGLMHCHISWHVALWALGKGDIEAMWRVVDADVAPDGAWGPAINVMTDMAAILYRAELAGVEVAPERWTCISDFARQFFPNTGLAFVDVHAAIAHAMAGNSEAVAKIITQAKGPAGEVVSVLSEGFAAIAGQNWQAAVNHFSMAMSHHARIGGSRAQRDLIEYALVGALLKQGRSDEATRMLAMRRPVAMSAGAVAGL